MNDHLRRSRTITLLAGAALLGTLAAGCGDDDSSDDDPDNAAGESPAASPSAMDDMDDMDDMMMNDPSATPANKLPDATEATFDLLDTAPPGSDAVEGAAWVAFGDPGTTLTVTLTGLEPAAEYVGHLHAQACAQDNGGPHFQFDPNGAETPPNEVHIGFTADGEGNGTATITNAQAAEDAAAVVIHPAEAQDNRLACADL